jgi:hypothetical protein
VSELLLLEDVAFPPVVVEFDCESEFELLLFVDSVELELFCEVWVGSFEVELELDVLLEPPAESLVVLSFEVEDVPLFVPPLVEF